MIDLSFGWMENYISVDIHQALTFFCNGKKVGNEAPGEDYRKGSDDNWEVIIDTHWGSDHEMWDRGYVGRTNMVDYTDDVAYLVNNNIPIPHVTFTPSESLQLISDQIDSGLIDSSTPEFCYDLAYVDTNWLNARFNTELMHEDTTIVYTSESNSV